MRMAIFHCNLAVPTLLIAFLILQFMNSTGADNAENVGVELKRTLILPDGVGFFKDYVHKSEPALFVKGANNWPATRLWRDRPYAEALYKDEHLRVISFEDNTVNDRTQTFKQFLRDCSSLTKKCVSYGNIINSVMIRDVYAPPFLQCQELAQNIESVNLITGNGNQRKFFQEAYNDFLHTVINGQKQVLLYDINFILKSRKDKGLSIQDLLGIDTDKVVKNHRDLVSQFTFNVSLNAGDMLFIPKLWLYHVESRNVEYNLDIRIEMATYNFEEEIGNLGISKTEDTEKYYRQFIKLKDKKPTEIVCSNKAKPLNSALKVSKNETETMHLRIPQRRKKPDDFILASGYKLPPIAFGTALLYEKTTAAVKTALEVGFRLIDTAQGYPQSEKRIAAAIRESKVPREDIFIITKLHPRYLGYQSTLDSIKKSMEDLETSYIDVFLIHSKECDDFLLKCEKDEPRGTWQESWKAMEEAHRLGFVRSLGVSNFEIQDMKKLLKLATVPVSVLQNWFDPIHQDTESRDFCAAHNISYQGYAALGGYWKTFGLSYNPVLTADLIIDIGHHYDYIAAHIPIRYAIHKNVTPIISSSDPNHIAQNYRALDISLRPIEIQAIDQFDDAMQKALETLDAGGVNKENDVESETGDVSKSEGSSKEEQTETDKKEHHIKNIAPRADVTENDETDESQGSAKIEL